MPCTTTARSRIPGSVGLVAVLAWLLLGVAWGGASAAGAPTAARASDRSGQWADPERWFVLRIADQRAGWMRERITRNDESITTSIETRVSMKRGAIGVEIELVAEFVETADGEPISMVSMQRLGMEPVTQRYFFEGETVRVIAEQGGFENEAIRPAPEGEWLTPTEAAAYVAALLESGAQEIVVRTIDPFSGLEPITIRRRGFEAVTIEVLGRSVPAVRCETVQSDVPGIRTIEYLGSDGRAIRSETSLGGIPVEIIAADRDLARMPVDAPELMARTFVKPSRAIPRPRAATRAVYTLSVPDGDLPDLPTTGAQSVVRLDARSARIEVDASFPSMADEAASEDASLLGRSAMLEVDDPEIAALRDRALRGSPERASARAEAMRRFVHRYVRSKSLDVGFATASEVARTRQGDCTEHAVLLAAMLRADGIPSRVASGLIFVDEFAGADRIFAYHMWTQALIESEAGWRWVDLDATLPDSVAFDATHLTLATTTFADNEPGNSLVGLVPLLGRLEIRVDTVEHDHAGLP